MSDAATCCLTALMHRSRAPPSCFPCSTGSLLRDVLALDQEKAARPPSSFTHLELDLARLLGGRFLRGAAGAEEKCDGSYHCCASLACLRCNAAPGLQCAVPAIPLQVVLLAWRVVLHECALLLQRREAVRAITMQLQLAVSLQLRPLPSGGASLAACGVWMHPLESRYGRIQVMKPCFSLRTGFGRAANGSGRRHC